MSQNYPSIIVFHRKSSITLGYLGMFVLFLLAWLQLRVWLLWLPVVIMGVSLLLYVRTVSFHDKYLSINSILRKRRIEYQDIDYVDFEYHNGRRKVGGTYYEYSYKKIRLTLTNGKKIKLKDFSEGDDELQFKIKTCVKAVKEYY